MLYLKMESSRLFCPFLHFLEISPILLIELSLVLSLSVSFTFLRQGCSLKFFCEDLPKNWWEMVPPWYKRKIHTDAHYDNILNGVLHSKTHCQQLCFLSNGQQFSRLNIGQKSYPMKLPNCFSYLLDCQS